MPRDTGTGFVLERMILPALECGGYECRTQVNLGLRPGRGRHFVDAVARKDGTQILVSVKWQQVTGTAEQKVPFEVICLAEALERAEGAFAKAYLVLGGEGWKLREFFTRGGLNKYLRAVEHVEIVTLEAFVAKANQGRL